MCNMHESKELITDLLSQLPDMFAKNMETGSALGPALQAAYKLVVGFSLLLIMIFLVCDSYF